MPSAVAEQAKQIEDYYKNLDENKESSIEDKGGDPISPSEPVESSEEVQEQPKLVVDNESEESYKKRYSNFKAHADKTIYEQREQLRYLEGVQAENQRLQQALSQVQTETPKEAPKFSKEALDNFSQEELGIFYGMMEDYVAKQTEQYKNQISILESKLHSQEQQGIQKKQEDAYEALKNQIKANVSDFDKIDTDPSFKQWLNDYDAYGTLRMDAFRRAQATQDIARIISFYNDFKQIQEPVKADPRELKQSPSSISSALTESQGPKKLWNQLEINQFYKDVALGKYTKEQKEKIEQEITESYRARRG